MAFSVSFTYALNLACIDLLNVTSLLVENLKLLFSRGQIIHSIKIAVGGKPFCTRNLRLTNGD